MSALAPGQSQSARREPARADSATGEFGASSTARFAATRAARRASAKGVRKAAAPRLAFARAAQACGYSGSSWIAFSNASISRRLESPDKPWEKCLPEQIALVRLRIRRTVLLRSAALAREEFHPERLDNGPGNLVLHHEDVGQFPVKGLAPDPLPRSSLHHLCANSDPVSRSADGALEDVVDREFPPDFFDLHVLALEVEGRRPARHPESRYPRQGRQDLLCHAVGEVLLVLVEA